ncbi:MAG: hypothetical protein RSE46_19600, partial [Janthinobacterium sp.]
MPPLRKTGAPSREAFCQRRWCDSSQALRSSNNNSMPLDNMNQPSFSCACSAGMAASTPGS